MWGNKDLSRDQCNRKKKKIDKVKNSFFEKFNKIAKPLGKWNKKKRKIKRRHNSPLLAVREGISDSTDSTDIKRIIMEYYEQLYINKCNNLDEMGKFLKKNFSEYLYIY